MSFYTDKKVLVTGGSGFVGSHIIEELLSAGAYVRTSIHNRPVEIVHPRVETVAADLRNPKECAELVKEAQFVFHAAGSVGAAGINALGAMDGITNNLALTANMLQAAWAESVDRFLVFGSSTGYPLLNHPVKEEEMWSGPVFPGYFGYGWMRRYLEMLSLYVHDQSDVNIAIVRPTAVYGERDNFDLRTCHVVPALIRKSLERQTPLDLWGSGMEVRDILYIKDLARACLLTVEKYAVGDPLNIGYGSGITLKELAALITKVCDFSSAEIICDPSKPTAIPFRLSDTNKARTAIGFEPQYSLEEGLKRTAQWYTTRSCVR